MSKEKYVQICPQCKSKNISIDFSNGVVWAYGTPTKYNCNNCGYIGAIFPEISKKYKKYQKEISNNKPKLIDTETGYSYALTEIIIIIGLILFYSIIWITKSYWLSIITLLIVGYIIYKYIKWKKNKK